MMKEKLKNGLSAWATSLLIIAVSLLVGWGVMFLIGGQEPVRAFGILLTAGLADSETFGKVLYQAAPLILTGLSVGLAMRAGLFNIGASGQFTVGAFCALVCGMVFQMPWYICILAGAFGGAAWGFFPGFFKAYFNVSEVISGILFNWIGLYAVNVAVANIPPMLPRYYYPADYPGNPNFSLEMANPNALIPKWGLDNLFGSPYLGAGILIALAFAIFIWFLLSKTTFGYKQKAIGLNKDAAQYAGIHTKRISTLSMVIAGALSGIAAALYYQSGAAFFGIKIELAPMGFAGIPVALLAFAHPIGTVFSALLISFLNIGGEKMQALEYSTQIIAIITAFIILFSAFAPLIRRLLFKTNLPIPENAPPSDDDPLADADPPLEPKPYKPMGSLYSRMLRQLKNCHPERSEGSN
ncbi:MAG: ABC transporter permease [Clostridiales bacterium]|nr:ABC transporter permease [Clostridiales bacterium]